MPNSLDSHHIKLAIQLQTLTSGFNRHLTVAASQRVLDRAAVREGLISSLWQVWCRFFRSVILTSASGGVTRSGVAITSAYPGLSEPQLLFVAKQLSNNANVSSIRSIAGHHLEPTWGDINKALNISNGMGFSNSGQLSTALSFAASIPDLQICRNATSHFGLGSLSQLKASRVRYTHTKLLHPTDACVWIDPLTNGYLWDTWVDEINTVASHACS
ncbi:hypothetical protein [Methylobacterium radiodurans]|uniref:hypothetical protein n=1 Tax=Methylobacterium radiodurans TaxID=2202828 RepID=UPI00194DC2B5|nr:hypothetical protein [Methylobacterium radiodurans]